MARVKKNDTWKIALRELLDGNLFTQKELGEMCGVSAQTVSNWMNDVRNPGIFAKRKIVKIIRETGSQMKRNSDILHSLKPAEDTEREKMAELFSGMTAEQRRKLTKMVEKMGG